MEHFLSRLSAARTPAEVEEAVTCALSRQVASAQALWNLVARQSPVLDDPLPRRLLAQCPNPALLLENPAVHSQAIDSLLQGLLHPEARQMPNGLREFASRGHLSPGSAHFEALLHLATSSHIGALQALYASLAIPDFPEERLSELALRSIPHPVLRRALALERDLPLAVYGILLLSSPLDEQVLNHLAAHPEVCAHPQYRSFLLAHVRPGLLLQLAPHLTASELERLLPEVAERSPYLFSALVEATPLETRQSLSRSSLLPLLKSEHAEVRLAAIRLSATLVPPTPEERKRALPR